MMTLTPETVVGATVRYVGVARKRSTLLLVDQVEVLPDGHWFVAGRIPSLRWPGDFRGRRGDVVQPAALAVVAEALAATR